MTQLYYRPLVQCGPKPPDALVLAGGWAWFDRVEVISRVAPVVEQLAAIGVGPLSIDTRKARVADITLKLGADLINDVSAMGYDPDMVRVLADGDAPVCLMHAQGAPATMQDDPQYQDVILDVYDELAEQIERACAAGIAKSANTRTRSRS